MKIPLSSLKKFLNFKHTPEELAIILTSLGLEVDAIDHKTPSFKNVVVVKIVDVKPHPNADLLSIVKTFDGKKYHTVVCAAPNCTTGNLAALAKVSATLHDEQGRPFMIKESKIRGMVSSGMLCSEKELGLSDNHEGIAHIHGIAVGTSLETFFTDTIFDISLTPNLGHCQSVLGIAKELSAKLKVKLLMPKLAPLKKSKKGFKTIKIETKECVRYCAAIFKNIHIEGSSLNIIKSLIGFGLKPINNIVDMTNILMMEYGLPLHAFDLDLLEGDTIHIKKAKTRSAFTTLDGKKRVLDINDLVICDAKKVVALAGLMGGKNSEVGLQAKNILLEAAVFDPLAVRKGAKIHQLRTEAAVRFEKGVDPLQVEKSLSLFAQGLGLTGSLIASPYTHSPRSIGLRTQRVEELLGMPFSTAQIKKLLHSLFCNTKEKRGFLKVEVPSDRNDLKEEIDLIEEVIRLTGFDSIPLDLAPSHFSTLCDSEIHAFEKKTATHLLKEGLDQFITCNLISNEYLPLFKDAYNEEEIVRLKDPSNQALCTLRPTLLIGLLESVAKNVRAQEKNIHSFEIGKIHLKEKEQFIEPLQLGIVMMGKIKPPHFSLSSRNFDFFDLKAQIEQLLSFLNIKEVEFEKSNWSFFHPYQQAVLKSKKLTLGAFGMLHPHLMNTFHFTEPCFCGEMSLNDLFEMQEQKKISPVSKFPSIQLDWTISLNDKFTYKVIEHAQKKMHSQFLETIELLDIYSGKEAKKAKNFTFRFTYRSNKATLEFDQCEKEHARILGDLTKALASFLQ
jgi:phenylalanyl-tRNA synthetase beta chain